MSRSEDGVSSSGGGDFLSEDNFMTDVRKRRAWQPDTDSLGSVISHELDLLSIDDLDEEEEYHGAGCPLPSTPEDTQLLEAEVGNGDRPFRRRSL